MRNLKLVVWDLDETILTGVFEEGDREINPLAQKVMKQMSDQGILQALATQNSTDTITAVLEEFGWSNQFVLVEADFGPKVRKVRRILDTLEINPLDSVFVDEDAFERDSIAVQIADITTWSVAQLENYLLNTPQTITDEGRRRPQMYLEQQARFQAEEDANDYHEFLRSCHIQVTIRPYTSKDLDRVEELLTRTHQMNLGVLPVAEAVSRLNHPDAHHVIIAELKDRYGDSGRTGVIHLRPVENDTVLIESLAISCRTRARGLSLAMLVGLLRHPKARFQTYHCRYIANGFNRPLRMLLLGAGFKPQPDTDILKLDAAQLANNNLPDWVNINYCPVSMNSKYSAND